MTTNKRLRPVRLRLEELEPRLAPATMESFDSSAVGTLPAGWSQWSSNGTSAFAVAASQAESAPNSLAANSPTASSLTARSWVDTAQPADAQVEAAVYLN